MRHFLSLMNFSKEEILDILALAKKIKDDAKAGKHEDYMPKKILGMIFEKSSTRTRVSFEAGIYELGGVGLFLSSNDIQLGRGEPMKDTARVISRMVDMVMIRTYEQEKLEEFASYSKVPVINGLTDKFHPVQLMADYLTIIEEGLDKNLVVAYIGDGNNMAHSWLNLAAKLGFELRIATPKAYQVNKEILEKALEDAKVSGAKITVGFDPKEAVKNATVVTTDTWISMGQEAEKNADDQTSLINPSISEDNKESAGNSEENNVDNSAVQESQSSDDTTDHVSSKTSLSNLAESKVSTSAVQAASQKVIN